MTTPSVDVLVVGAGLSGICATHYLAARCPELSFRIVEARDRLGGTWDLFRYPGIRSDSDMYTFGFSFRPWKDPKAIASGEAILAYLNETAREEGLLDKISFRQRVEAVSWSTAAACWSVTLRDTGSGEATTTTCRFLWVCAGYYRYDQGHTPDFAGRERFGGPIVHPQHWPEDLDVNGKRVVIVGSGATAVTLAPTLAARGAVVTLVQRTPTYVVSRPSVDRFAEALKRTLPAPVAHAAVRWKNLAQGSLFYQYCQRFPESARRLIRAGVKAELGPDYPVDRDFDPPYGPWDQRLCLVPDGDLFRAVREGRVEIVTDGIEGFDEGGLALRSGRHLDADVIVTATGLEVQFLGGAALEVDGQPIDVPRARVYRGCLLSDVPNCAFVLGYVNASWTLKAELACDYVARLLRHLKDHDQHIAVARVSPDAGPGRPVIEMTSGYFQRAAARLPQQGQAEPWRFYQSWFADRRQLGRPVDDGVLELR